MQKNSDDLTEEQSHSLSGEQFESRFHQEVTEWMKRHKRYKWAYIGMMGLSLAFMYKGLVIASLIGMWLTTMLANESESSRTKASICRLAAVVDRLAYDVETRK